MWSPLFSTYYNSHLYIIAYNTLIRRPAPIGKGANKVTAPIIGAVTFTRDLLF